MKNRRFLLICIIAIVLTLVCAQVGFSMANKQVPSNGQVITVKPLAASVVADGTVHSQSEATLHFQTGGRLAYLPFQIGDSVSQGQTVAQLDTYQLQQQLAQALNNYRSTRDVFDQNQQNYQTGVMKGQQQFSLQTQNSGAFATRSDEDQIIYDMAKRILDENQATLDNSVANVNLANYAIQLASITAPFSGVITAEDVTTSNVNVTPQTSFSIADPNSLVFRANVNPQDLPLVSVGSPATVSMSGGQTIAATVQKIYPQQTMVNGRSIYLVDLVAQEWGNDTKLGQVGSVSIQSAEDRNTVLLPRWLVVNHTQVWIERNGKAVLTNVTTGKTYGNVTEIIAGLNPGDHVITDPTVIAKKQYSIL